MLIREAINKLKLFIEILYFRVFKRKYSAFNKNLVYILTFNTKSRLNVICEYYKKKYDNVVKIDFEEKKKFLQAILSKNKKVLLVKDGSDLINFIFFPEITFDIYDTVKGNKNNFILEKIEKLSFLFIKKIIHRDLRITRLYKKNIIRPRVFISDHALKKKIKSQRSYSSFEKIKILSIGWIDQEDVSIEKSIHFFCSRGAKIDIFMSSLNKKIYSKRIRYFLKTYPQLITFKDFVKRETLLNIMNLYDFGICPHDSIDNRNFKIEKNYYESCGSTRLCDYSFSQLDVILSRRYKFQHKQAKSLGLRVLLTEDYDKIKSVQDINKHLK